MITVTRYRVGLAFVGGIVIGTVISLATLRLSGFALISQQELDEQFQLIAALQEENQVLTDDLFAYQKPEVMLDTSDLPYKDEADASTAVTSARQRALDSKRFLMVTFGANWCIDCRTLYYQLRSPDVQAYTADTVDFVNVNVGNFDINIELAAQLGVDLRRGIPVALFFGPDGEVIGTTNEGQLKPARFYTSTQILKFIRDIVEKSLIAAPDSVQ